MVFSEADDDDCMVSSESDDDDCMFGFGDANSDDGADALAFIVDAPARVPYPAKNGIELGDDP